MSIIILVKVTPGARKSRMAPGQQTDLICWVHARAQEGKANEELVKLLAETARIPQRSIAILAGHTARIKRLQIEGFVDKKDFLTLLDLPVQHALCDVDRSCS